MRLRGKTIRRKLVALLLVPLASLGAVWAFATVLTGREAARLADVSAVMEHLGGPVEDTVRALQEERRLTLTHLADPRASDGLAALRRSRFETDDAVAVLRDGAAAPDVRRALEHAQAERLAEALDALDGVDALRRGVEAGTIDRHRALDLYNGLVDPGQALLADLHVIDDVALDTEHHALVNIARARELLSREDALLGSALVAGRVTQAEVRAASDLVAQRTLLYDVNLPMLPAAELGHYERFWEEAPSLSLREAEGTLLLSAPGTPDTPDAAEWEAVATDVLDGLASLGEESAARYRDRVSPVATAVVTRAAVAGVLGLAALSVSLLVSVRVGRGLVRDLRRLGAEAHEAARVRLPSVMRRLASGDRVDVETEVPRLDYARDEIGEVGRALNTLQRAAVRAAVRQAEIRSGVSDVLVNLARRSQVLLHRQLTLLDAMERRTEDPGELADLFRLDHLTTRMRRHAEGLVILSGAAPSRQWRRPVPLMDVVRAAVAEVEDYERVEVRRLPRIAVTGPAVADLTHLLAELVENGAAFSPPHTAVQVRGERVGNGFLLEIHDRGLGMTADTMTQANLRLAGHAEFDLRDSDRLGLFVVSRLALRRDVQVSVQPSPYGGTTAVVLIPETLLTAVEDDDTAGPVNGRPLDEPSPATGSRALRLSRSAARAPGAVPPGPVELEPPVEPEPVDAAPEDREGPLPDVGPWAPRSDTGPEETISAPGPFHREAARPRSAEERRHPTPLPRRTPPRLVSSHGRLVGGDDAGHPATPATRRPALPDDTCSPAGAPDPAEGESRKNPGEPERPMPRTSEPVGRARVEREESGQGGPPAGSGAVPHVDRPALGGRAGHREPDSAVPGRASLPRRLSRPGQDGDLGVDGDSLTPQRRPGAEKRDAEEVRGRMAAVQRGWRRGRSEAGRNGRGAPGRAPGGEGVPELPDAEGSSAPTARAPTSLPRTEGRRHGPGGPSGSDEREGR
ncbi:nitrate- and nitrite sensing domain-containing protein [Streptomyces sp. WMMC905]|uniref:nitrate- and nitrite sensing domain-containing protein n=1 Tax=Streptomyces sp. WMMC905 TaxID=3404123 RepID=UPI003B950575